MSKKILVVDDESEVVDWLCDDLGEKAVVISARTIEEAIEQFAAHPDIDAIAMDGCIGGHDIDTLPLVKKFRATFQGPMIAISSSDVYKRQLLQAGCNYKSSKSSLSVKLTEILDL